jgi:hypothetical protein
MSGFYSFWAVFGPAFFYGIGVWVGMRLSRDRKREENAYAKGWHDALSKRRVVLSVAEKFLKEDA